MYKLTDIYQQIKEEQSQYKIYCDMDGVIADFDNRFQQVTYMYPLGYEHIYGIEECWVDISKDGI